MYRVRWIQTAVNELTAIWVNADSKTRKLITAATHAIDKELQDDPQEKGESRPGDFSIFISMPLGVYFRIYELRKEVEVFHVWLIRSRRKP